jgi:hypothetical protein
LQAIRFVCGRICADILDYAQVLKDNDTEMQSLIEQACLMDLCKQPNYPTMTLLQVKSYYNLLESAEVWKLEQANKMQSPRISGPALRKTPASGQGAHGESMNWLLRCGGGANNNGDSGNNNNGGLLATPLVVKEIVEEDKVFLCLQLVLEVLEVVIHHLVDADQNDTVGRIARTVVLMSMMDQPPHSIKHTELDANDWVMKKQMKSWSRNSRWIPATMMWMMKDTVVNDMTKLIS